MRKLRSITEARDGLTTGRRRFGLRGDLITSGKLNDALVSTFLDTVPTRIGGLRLLP